MSISTFFHAKALPIANIKMPFTLPNAISCVNKTLEKSAACIEHRNFRMISAKSKSLVRKQKRHFEIEGTKGKRNIPIKKAPLIHKMH